MNRDETLARAALARGRARDITVMAGRSVSAVCRNGHERTPQNTAWDRGRPSCRDCRTDTRTREEVLLARWFMRALPRPDGCWLWLGQVNEDGYGYFAIDGSHKVVAHRWGYEQLVAPVDDDLVLDHLCRHRTCCNPAHLEPVTQAENILRGEGHAAVNAAKTHCPAGHPYDGDNLYVTPRGGRICRTCARVAYRRYDESVRPSVTGSPRVTLAGTNAAPLTPRATPAGPGRATSEPGLGGAQALRAGLAEGRAA